MSKRKHVVITGTGRSGTTLLVELLTHVGLDTGFTSESISSCKHENARAGLEHDLRQDVCPYIVKDLYWGSYADEILDRSDVEIEHVFIPIRNVRASTDSRRFVTNTNIENLNVWGRLAYVIKPQEFAGGVRPAGKGEGHDMEEVLLRRLHTLLLALSSRKVPITLLHYPTLARDSGYLFKKLQPILTAVDEIRFREVFARTVKPELVHQFNSDDQ